MNEGPALGLYLCRCRPAIPKAVIQGLRGRVLDVVSYYLAIGRFKWGKGAIFQDAKSRPLAFTFPMLHKQLVIIAYLTVCLSLLHRICLYPLDFGVFLLFCS